MIAVYAQSITNLPPNSKHSDDYEIFPRPRLSMIGFNNPNVNYGYGVKQVLDKTYGVSPDPLVRDVYIQIINDAYLPVPAGTDRESITTKSHILQARAFEALMS